MDPRTAGEDNVLSPVCAAAGRREGSSSKLPGTTEGSPELSEATCSL